MVQTKSGTFSLVNANLHHTYRALVINVSHEKHRDGGQTQWDIMAIICRDFRSGLFISCTQFPKERRCM